MYLADNQFEAPRGGGQIRSCGGCLNDNLAQLLSRNPTAPQRTRQAASRCKHADGLPMSDTVQTSMHAVIISKAGIKACRVCRVMKQLICFLKIHLVY